MMQGGQLEISTMTCFSHKTSHAISPAPAHHGNMNPPKQASTWSGRPCWVARSAVSGTGSTIP